MRHSKAGPESPANRTHHRHARFDAIHLAAVFTFGLAAYNLIRLPKLLEAPA
jgi:hypothetical protein